MYRKVIAYKDFDGNAKSNIFYFNLTRPELVEMKRSPLVEMQKMIERVRGMEDPENELTVEEKDEIQEKMGGILRDLVILSYGVKSADGERFVKRVGDRPNGAGEDFVETMAYDALYMEMLSNFRNLIDFVRAIIPESIRPDLENNPEFQKGMKELESIQQKEAEEIKNDFVKDQMR